MEIPGVFFQNVSTNDCAMRSLESSFSSDITKRSTAFKFINNTCTLGQTPQFHDAFWNKTTNDESAVHVALNTKPIGTMTNKRGQTKAQVK